MVKNKKLISISSIIFLLFVIVNMNSSYAKTIYVDDIEGEGLNNPAENYSTIQSALDNATNGDTIYVYSGNYRSIDTIIINKTIILTGENKNNTNISVDILKSLTEKCIIQIKSENVEILNFNIQPIIDLYHQVDGIRIYNDNSKINNNIISKCISGIYLRNSSNNEFKNNIIKNNTVGMNSYINTDNNKILNNEFLGNALSGVNFFYDKNTYFLNNYFFNNINYGINLIQTENITIRNNIYEKNGVSAIRLSTSENSEINDNEIKNNGDYGIFLILSKNNTIYDNTIHYNNIGINVSSDSIENNIYNNQFDGNNIDINSTKENKSNCNSSDKNILIYVLIIGLILFIIVFIYMKKNKK